MRVCHQCGVACKADGRFCAACGATLSDGRGSGVDDPLLGRTIGGAYTLREVIGVGGMGRVYRAEQGMLGRTVAVKVIHPHLLGDEQTVARFYTEARAASRLNHPNSVGIIDFGRTEDGVLYLVMEHLRGHDLAVVLAREGPLPLPRVCDILDAVLDALAEAHAIGVVHRDLKPENLILRRRRGGGDLVKVVDFGLATITGAAAAPGQIAGTPEYMSPEQGRGDPVDGRGDLYGAGVLLFELLTSHLPFRDETPTRVLTRHLKDPVPDPRDRAPIRDIPRELAEVCVRALQKAPEDRFQTAEEMQLALRRAAEVLRVARSGAGRTCAVCAATNPGRTRFCGSCGARLPDTMAPAGATPVRPSTRPSFHARASERPLVGRDDELARLVAARERAATAPFLVHLRGELGAGRSRLLEELATSCEQGGDVVAGGRPHPSGAPVPLWPIRRLLASLFGLPDDGLARVVQDDGYFPEPLDRAGVREVLSPEGLRGLRGEHRCGAVAGVVAAAVRVARERAPSRRVAVLVDDLHRCDLLTREVLRQLPGRVPDVPLLLAAVVPPGGPSLSDHAEEIAITGLDLEAATRFFGLTGAISLGGRLSRGGDRRLSPLYLEQLDALALGDDSLPPRLADAVAQRVERLPLPARRTLQALCVLGESCSTDDARAVTHGTDGISLEGLVSRRVVVVDDDRITICHPFVRDLVEASIPAQARRELHRAALDVTTEAGAPLEVRAHHAYGAGDPVAALVLLERMGDTAVDRGDPEAAVTAFQGALALARREALESGDHLMDGARVSFGRKLGRALTRVGDLAGADGVLREALDLSPPAGAERVRLFVALAEVAALRDRRRDAARLLGRALELADGDARLIGHVGRALGRARLEEGDALGAANALRDACDALDDAGADPAERALAQLELGEALADAGDTAAARERLERAATRAREIDARAVAARAVGTLGALSEVEGDRADARTRYAEAATLAAEAGDAASAARWRRAARQIGSASTEQSSPTG